METGTGKTYVYLRSIFELNKKYGFKKFVIVMRASLFERVCLKILILRGAFPGIYTITLRSIILCMIRRKLVRVRQFATSNQIQIMIINIDAFRKTLEE